MKSNKALTASRVDRAQEVQPQTGRTKAWDLDTVEAFQFPNFTNI
jgi:hypothetical protein